LKGDAAANAFGALSKNVLLVVAVLLAAFFLGSIIFGAYLNYSPVPMTDTWTGMVDFYVRSKEDPLVWWEQHNEHRIFFSKLLFWLDMRYFAGSGLLLIPVNIILLSSVWWALAAFANRLVEFSSFRERTVFFGVLGLLCLSWMQNQNIIFSFQSMFILVFLFPLLSFYFFARAVEARSHVLLWFSLSLFFGAASAHCMANGVFALPMLAWLSWYSKGSRRLSLIVLACAVASLAVFLVGYKKTLGGAQGIAILQAEPLHVIGFVLAYLGGPFYVIFHKIEAAMIAGGAAVALAVYFFLRRSVYQSQPYALALLAYVGYVFATAGMTALGRTLFGYSFAMSSRYQTPTLIMWAALLILLLSRCRRVAPWPGVALVVIAALLLPVQMRALRLSTDSILQTPQIRAVAGLALQLGIHDVGAKNVLVLFYNEHDEAVFQRARQNKAALFSERYAYPANQIGTPLQEAGGEPCSGQITFHRLVDDGRAAYKVGGTLAPGSAETFRYILFGDAQGVVKGVAIPGRDKDGEAGAAAALNFDGYVFAQPDSAGMRCIR
jgi:hypothetical protein